MDHMSAVITCQLHVSAIETDWHRKLVPIFTGTRKLNLEVDKDF